MTKKIETFHQHRWLAEAEIGLINEQIFTFFDREIAQALAVLQVAIVSIDFKRFVYTDLDD